MAQPNTQGKGQKQESQEDNLKAFTLGHKELEGKVAEFLYDRGTYTIVDIVGEEKTEVLRSRSAQEAYTKWNVYIGRKKERPQRERSEEEETGKRDEGKRSRGGNGGRGEGGRQENSGRGNGSKNGNGGRGNGGGRGNNGGKPAGGGREKASTPASEALTPGQKSNQEVLQALRESNGLEGGASKHRRRRRHGRGNGGNGGNNGNGAGAQA